MDQMVVNFRMLPNLLWSDGTPLTAEDSIYSYALASDPETIGSKYLYERTQSYEATDERSVQWWGKPGFIDPTYFTNFWMPLPQHLWGEFDTANLPNTDVASVFPVGWGPYMIADWIAGDSILLVRNPNYFRAEDGLPYFDELIYRFAPDPEQAISMLLAGRCDLLAPSVPLDHQVGLLLSMEASGLLQAEFSQSMVMEHLAFGIRPAGYDDGFSLLAGDRPDVFGDPRMRQAIAMCVDRQEIVDSVLNGLTSVPDSLLPVGHPLYNPSITTHPYNITQAIQLLEQVGWKDDDGDPATPRLARNITGVFDGTRLEFDLWTSDSFQRRQVSQGVADSLAQCGIRVNLHYDTLETLYAPGPDGLLRGRQFDIVEAAMGSLGMDPVCEWFLGSQIPSAGNDWDGINFSGYANPEYDSACYTAMGSLQDDEAYLAAYREIQQLFAENLPALPLYWRIQVATARPDLCNFLLDPVATSNLYNLESYGYGIMCSP
jgi:peptide/nickel transport system substrate-binding protein